MQSLQCCLMEQTSTLTQKEEKILGWGWGGGAGLQARMKEGKNNAYEVKSKQLTEVN